MERKAEFFPFKQFKREIFLIRKIFFKLILIYNKFFSAENLLNKVTELKLFLTAGIFPRTD